MTVRVPRWLIASLVTLWVVGLAHAEDRAAAKRHFERGEKLFALGKFDDALDQYQHAYDAAPIPDFLFNIGQCHRNLGDYESAIFSFRKYLKLVPDADDREQVEAYIKELELEQDKRNSERLKLTEEKRREPTLEDPPPSSDTPFYKKWWFWTGVVVVGAAGGATLYVATRPDVGPPETTLGNIVFGK